MKSFPLRRVLAAALLLGVAGVGLAGWRWGAGYAERRVQQLIQEGLTQNADLVLAPFTVRITPWREFPHLTASVQGLALTDTAHRRAVPVLRVGRADLRLALAGLLRGQTRVTRLTLTDVDFRERVDSLGRTWGLRGQRRRGTSPPPTLNLALDEVVVNNFTMSTRNAYARSAFGARVARARLRARLRGGVLRVAGTLEGELSYLRTRAGTLFEREPVWGRVHYSYTFARHQGHLWRTRATLNGDTVQVRGTHTADPTRPVGTALNLRFVGNQPLTDVLRAALPPRLRPFLTGAVSPSKAHIHYTIRGLSGPTVSPRNVLTFGLRGARLVWPDSARRISRWDLQGTYDNGPAHAPRTTVLALQRCRIYSPAGQLDAALTLRDFARPYVQGRLRGRTELSELAAVVSPGRWRARGGVADLDVALRGRLPGRGSGPATAAGLSQHLAVRGRVTLRGASLLLPERGADLRALNVRIDLRDSLWQLSNAAGVLNGMRFRASATTVHLLDYLADRHPTASIRGQFAVDELRVDRLRRLLRPLPLAPLANGPGFAPSSRPKPGGAAQAAARRARNRARMAATLGTELIPPGLLLDVGLRCRRLLLATDTLTDLAVTVRHDGRQVQLLDLAGRVWGGQVRGRLQWPTDSATGLVPVRYALGVRFATLDYRQLVARLNRPATKPPRAPGRGPGAAVPALRDLLLAANGRLDLDIATVQLPEGETLRAVHLRLQKTGPRVQLPYLRFLTPEGGAGEASGAAQVSGGHLLTADADVTLRYATLDVQRLLGLIASLTTPADSVPTARTEARTEARAGRRAAPGNPSLLANDALSAVLRVEADQVRYGVIRGSRFRLVSRLHDGEARLDNCSFEALQGRVSLRGRLQSTATRQHHPAQVQVQLEDVQLPALFEMATTLGLNVLGGDNIRGTLRGVADLRTDLDAALLPARARTAGYLRTDIRDLELLNVEALMEALKFMKAERTGHLYFEPVRSEFLLSDGQLLIPDLRLNSNLSNLAVSGTYGLDGRADLFIGLKPMQALFGNNDRRIARIQSGEPASRSDRKLTYVSLRRAAPTDKYKVHLFQKDEQRREQAALRARCRALLLTQRLDTTVRLLR